MFDEVTAIAWYAWPVAAPIVFAFTMWRLRSTRARSRIGAALSFSAASALAMLVLTLSSMFRDGLAFGLVPSNGWAAVLRTLEGLPAFGLPALVLLVPLVVVGCWASKSPRADSKQDAGHVRRP